MAIYIILFIVLIVEIYVRTRDAIVSLKLKPIQLLSNVPVVTLSLAVIYILGVFIFVSLAVVKHTCVTYFIDRTIFLILLAAGYFQQPNPFAQVFFSEFSCFILIVMTVGVLATWYVTPYFHMFFLI